MSLDGPVARVKAYSNRFELFVMTGKTLVSDFFTNSNEGMSEINWPAGNAIGASKYCQDTMSVPSRGAEMARLIADCIPSLANRFFALVTDSSSDFQPEGISKLEVKGPKLELGAGEGFCANAKFGEPSIENA